MGEEWIPPILLHLVGDTAIVSVCKQRYDSDSIQAVAEAKEDYLSWQGPICQMETNGVIIY